MDELNHKDEISPCLSPGTVLYNKYEILYVIGQGGCGRVYKARDIKSHDIIWAVKEIFSMEESSALNVKEIFRREASMLSSLTHKHIPKIKEYFIIDPSYYIVMEYIEGKTLQEIYKNEQRLWTEKELAGFAISLCDVLIYLHEHSVVFRDLKTKNIIIDEYEVPKLIDFGIARHFRPDQTEDTIKIGTVGYAAPEQYGKKGGGSDERTDIYALGVLLHYLATGDDPEEKKDPFYFIPVREINRNISVNFEELINRCIKFRKDERFASVRDIKKELKKLHSEYLSCTEKIGESLPEKKKYNFSPLKKEKKYAPSPVPAASKIMITEQIFDDCFISNSQKNEENNVKITTQGNERYIIKLPPEGINGEKIGGLLFMAVWLTGWTTGGIFALFKLITDFNCFLFFWLCFWILFEGLAGVTLINLITSMVGRVSISFAREYMKIKIYWLGVFPVEKAYPLCSLTDLHLDKIPEPSATKKENFPEGLPHVITVKSKDKKINIPFKGTDDENRWLYTEIKHILTYLGCEKI